MRPRFIGIIACIAAALPVRLVAAQGTAADYQRSADLNKRFEGLETGAIDTVEWIGPSRFVYRTSVKGGHQFVLVDATTKDKRPAFDHSKLAASLSKAESLSVKDQLTAVTLPFRMFAYADNEQKITFVASRFTWQCTLSDYVCTRSGAAPTGQGRGGRGGGAGDDEPLLEPAPYEGPWDEDGMPVASEPAVQQQQQQQQQQRAVRSPDGKLEAYVENYDLWVRPTAGGQATPLSDDGSAARYYTAGRGGLAWSPDSKKIVAYRVTPGTDRHIHYVLSSPLGQEQPKDTVSALYRKPGDVVDYKKVMLFDVATKHATPIDETLFPNAYTIGAPTWWQDGRAFTFTYNQRGHQAYKIIEVDGTTGKARALIDEESKTFIYYNALPATASLTDAGRTYYHAMADGKEIIWMSERDGWAQLYLYDGATGAVKNQITKGNFVVRSVNLVDEQKRQIWFTAGGMNPDQDPYLLHYYRINFDGTGLTALTTANGNHSLAWSPNRDYYVDSYSRVDMAPVSELHRTTDQQVVMELEHGSTAELVKAGWSPPEVFAAKGRDGTTDIWGVIYRPTNFNPHKKYPVIENIYAGPQGSFVPKTFAVNNAMRNLAELGFIVVQIDGMGTANRSKAFHDVAWKNLGDAGFPDRILWHQAVAKKYPWYDITRVGIYGTSAGGQNALGAMLFHPEFYKVSYSASGCHDNRMDKIWWNEQWMGWPIGPQYAASSNVDNAYKLQGKLMLVFGEHDTNVDPSSTLQVVNQLILHNKMFDLLELPNTDHTSGGPYGDKKRNDFFVHNLLGVEPAARNGTTTPTDPGAGSGGRRP